MLDLDQERGPRFYAEFGEIARVATHRRSADWLARDLRGMNLVVQGLLVHDGWLNACAIPFVLDRVLCGTGKWGLVSPIVRELVQEVPMASGDSDIRRSFRIS